VSHIRKTHLTGERMAESLQCLAMRWWGRDVDFRQSSDHSSPQPPRAGYLKCHPPGGVGGTPPPPSAGTEQNRQGSATSHCAAFAQPVMEKSVSVTYYEGRGSSVGIATGYGTDGLGIEGEIFSIVQTSCGPPSLLYNRYWFFPGGKAAGVWR
jgi:hypothetical protein